MTRNVLVLAALMVAGAAHASTLPDPSAVATYSDAKAAYEAIAEAFGSAHGFAGPSNAVERLGDSPWTCFEYASPTLGSGIQFSPFKTGVIEFWDRPHQASIAFRVENGLIGSSKSSDIKYLFYVLGLNGDLLEMHVAGHAVVQSAVIRALDDKLIVRSSNGIYAACSR